MRPVPGAPDEGPVTLAETGNVYVTDSAAQTYAHYTGREREEARRWLTTLLQDARRLRGTSEGGAELWRLRSRPHEVDVTAHVSREGPLAKVVHVGVRPYGPRRPGSQRRKAR